MHWLAITFGFFTPGITVNPSVTEDDCTFEHPCAGLNSNIINSINNIRQNARLYLARDHIATLC